MKIAEQRKAPDNGDLVAPQPGGSEPARTPPDVLGRVRTMLVLLAVFLGGQVSGILLGLLTFRPSPTVDPPPTLSLGRFRFVAPPEDPGLLRACEFELSLLIQPQWRTRLADKLRTEALRFRQAVEELLREARSADFTDPTLRQLKRHIGAKLNEAMGIAAVAEVIVTDFRPEWGQPPERPSTVPASHESTGFPPRPVVDTAYLAN